MISQANKTHTTHYLNRIVLYVFVLAGLTAFSAGCIPQKGPIRSLESERVTGVFHRILPGQTLALLARAYSVSIQWIAEINTLTEPYNLIPGQELFIPGAKKVLFVAVPPVAPKVVKNWWRKTIRRRAQFRWPLKGRLSSYFGIRRGRHHDGIDISAPLGTLIRAASAGKVIYSNKKIKGYGNLILIRHRNHYITVYAHNQINLVKKGQMVRRGQVIALVGKTGRATGPHLHFEVRHEKRPRNPLFYLKRR